MCITFSCKTWADCFEFRHPNTGNRVQEKTILLGNVVTTDHDRLGPSCPVIWSSTFSHNSPRQRTALTKYLGQPTPTANTFECQSFASHSTTVLGGVLEMMSPSYPSGRTLRLKHPNFYIISFPTTSALQTTCVERAHSHPRFLSSTTGKCVEGVYLPSTTKSPARTSNRSRTQTNTATRLKKNTTIHNNCSRMRSIIIEDDPDLISVYEVHSKRHKITNEPELCS